MKSILIKNKQPNSILSEMQSHFGAKSELTDNCLRFQDENGSGEVEHLSLEDGINLYRFNMLLTSSLKINFQAKDAASLNFCYCSDGDVFQSFENEEEKEKLNKFKTTIIGHPQKSISTFEMKEDKRINLVLISVNLNGSAETESCMIKKRIHQLFNPHHENGFLFYRGSYNLKIADKIRQLEDIEETGVVRQLMTEGLIKYILALEVKQHGEDMSHAINDLGSLRVSEMEMIKELTTFIDNNIHLKLNLDFLKSKTGLSPKKLQEGFKLMHGKTVNDYIKKIRLQVAEHLIKTSDLNISEVVYTIGLSSRSYFSRIFLEHYKMCPKDYKDRHGVLSAV